MANTNQLKTVVEKEMIDTFCKNYGIEILKLSTKHQQDIFCGMEPDLIAYDKKNNTLFLGEITTSGYMGQRGKDFHVGAVKKVFEAFSKFYLFHDDKDGIRDRLMSHTDKVKFSKLRCFFIVPEGSKFINSLGYRDLLFQTRYMDLETVELTKETHKIMMKVLLDSKEENQT